MNKLKRLFLIFLFSSAAFLFLLPVFNPHQVWAQSCGTCTCLNPPVCSQCDCDGDGVADPPAVAPPGTPSLGDSAALIAGITYFTEFAIGIAGGFALLLLIFGGIKYVTSAGKPDEIKEAQSIITAAIIGLLVILLSVLILSTMSDALGLQWGS